VRDRGEGQTQLGGRLLEDGTRRSAPAHEHRVAGTVVRPVDLLAGGQQAVDRDERIVLRVADEITGGLCVASS
jgi:hypothetical protein